MEDYLVTCFAIANTSNFTDEWGWQYVFPADDYSTDPRSVHVRRNHLDEQWIQRAVRDAVRAANYPLYTALLPAQLCNTPTEGGTRHPHRAVHQKPIFYGTKTVTK